MGWLIVRTEPVESRLNMNAVKKLREYEELLRNAAEAEIAVKLFKMQLNLEIHEPKQPNASDLNQYLLDNATWLTEQEISFLQRPNHSPTEVAERLDSSVSTVKRMCDNGKLSHTKKNGRYRIDSLSVMEFLDNAKTKKTT